MNAVPGQAPITELGREALAPSARTRLLIFTEVLGVYAVVQALIVLWRGTGIFQWEVKNLGWSYLGISILIGIPALVAWLTRRRWAEYGVSSAEWQTNLAIGMKANLVRMIPIVPIALGWGSSVETVGWIIAVVLMVWIMNRQKPVRSGRENLIVTVALLVLPVLVTLAMGSLSVVIASTVVWQFFLSGFGEEFAYRGYTQSRLNQAFGRPAHLFGIQFGPGLIIASLLFGLLHAFNSFDPAIGFSSLGLGSGIGSFVAGLFFGVLREKTGTLIAPGIAHGLLDGVGEPLRKVFGI